MMHHVYGKPFYKIISTSWGIESIPQISESLYEWLAIDIRPTCHDESGALEKHLVTIGVKTDQCKLETAAPVQSQIG